MLPHHWIDDIFSSLEFSEIENSINLVNSEKFRDAISKARVAFQEVKEEQERNPEVIGCSPAQAARIAFLNVLNG